MTFLGQNTGKVIYVPPGGGPSRWAFGDRYTLKSGEYNTGKTLTLIEAVIPPGGGPPPHIHHWEEEAFYVLDGSVEFQNGEDRIGATNGSFVYVPRGALHAFKNTTDEPCKMLILFVPGGKDRFFLGYPSIADNGAPPPPIAQHKADLERVLRVGPEFGDEYVI